MVQVIVCLGAVENLESWSSVVSGSELQNVPKDAVIAQEIVEVKFTIILKTITKSLGSILVAHKKSILLQPTYLVIV